MTYTKLYKAYVLIDPITNKPRYVGITQRQINQRFVGHMNDVRNRPDLNKHKTAWFNSLIKKGYLPRIEQIAEFDTEEEMKNFEIEYIKKYKKEYRLINQTAGGDYVSTYAYDRNVILKKKNTKAVVQWNVLGEKVAEYDITEDAGRALGLKSCSKITACCKGYRCHAHGYIWTYKDDPKPDFAKLNPLSAFFNIIVLYKNGKRIKEFKSIKETSIFLNYSAGDIATTIKGKQKTIKGYTIRIEPKYVFFDKALFDSVYNDAFDTSWKRNRGIIRYNKNGEELGRYYTYREAAEACAPSTPQLIKACCEGKRKYYKDSIWKFARLSINPSNSENEPLWSTQS